MGDLRSQTSFYEMREGLQQFTTEDLRIELGIMGLLRPCKTYNLNVTAEIEGDFFQNLWIITMLNKERKLWYNVKQVPLTFHALSGLDYSNPANPT